MRSQTAPESEFLSPKQATRLKAAGSPIGANALWTACHALAKDASLVTHDTREFERVAGLRVEEWVRAMDARFAWVAA